MIVYSETKRTFILDTLNNFISSKIEDMYVKETGYRVGRSEVASWSNSMQFMKNILEDAEIPDDVGVAIEYKIPQTSKRIDFIITGSSGEQKSAILIELKQWSDGLSTTKKDAVLKADFYNGREISHPSYQAWSYSSLLNDYNENVQRNNVLLRPCAYLHNYSVHEGVLNDSFYEPWTRKAPIFFREDVSRLRDFIKKFVKYGDHGTLMYEIENGRIRPSKSLADALQGMLMGNKEFTLIDSQKIVYENGLDMAKESMENSAKKQVMIVTGGPGTGKSVVAINLLVELTKHGAVAQYVTRNSAPREVFQAMLTGSFTKSRISNLFTGSGAFYDVQNDTFDTLIVDEAQRLNKKSGLFQNKGKNQIDELIKASKSTVFFIDEDQRVTLRDIGEVESIRELAKSNDADVKEFNLESQFRCNGSDGYLAWVDDVLQIRKTANTSLEDIDYDLRVVSSPALLHEKILDWDSSGKKARLLAGYCWNWISKKNNQLYDIEIDEYKARWNLDEHGQAWIIHPDSVSEVGCIHTSQGLELDYVGVIIGPDFVVRDGKVCTDPLKRARTDKSMHGYKKLLKEDPEKAKAIGDMIVKNTYRVLMTRGMKGCYVYSTDDETQEYFKKRARI